MKLFIWHWQHFDLITIADTTDNARLNIVRSLNLEDDFLRYNRKKANVSLFDILYNNVPEIKEDFTQFYIKFGQWPVNGELYAEN